MNDIVMHPPLIESLDLLKQLFIEISVALDAQQKLPGFLKINLLLTDLPSLDSYLFSHLGFNEMQFFFQIFNFILFGIILDLLLILRAPFTQI